MCEKTLTSGITHRTPKGAAHPESRFGCEGITNGSSLKFQQKVDLSLSADRALDDMSLDIASLLVSYLMINVNLYEVI